MCGIVGVLQYFSPVPLEVRSRALKILFSELMLRTEPRGDDATGLYQIHRDGDWMLAKKGQKVSQWLHLPQGKGTDPVVYKDVLESWAEHPQELSALVGHCRKATIGSRGESNDDNHPFCVQVDAKNSILGIHNGTLTNHEKIFEKLQGYPKRQGTVDSEAIFHLLYHATEHGNKPITKEVLCYLGKRLDGAYAVITANTKFPNQVAVFRYDRPVEMFMIKPLNILVLVSEKRYMDPTLDTYNFIRSFLDPELPELDVMDRILPERDFRIFDTNLQFPTGNKLAWQDFDTICTHGVMREVANPVLPEWKSNKSAITNYVNKWAPTPATPAAPVTPSIPAIPASAGASAQTKTPTSPSAVGKVVDVEVESKEELPYFKAKSQGLSIHYDTVQDLSLQFSKTAGTLNAMSSTELANMVSEFSFNTGYALACVDRKNEVEEVRRKGREQLSHMEKMAEKRKRSERRIWDLKQALLLAIALQGGGYPLNAKNADILLSSLTTLEPKRKKDVLEAIQQVLEDGPAMKLVKDWQRSMLKAKENKQGK